MREVVLDTETTGLEPSAGHRIVEVGAVELVNHIPSGRRFQRYLDPERDMPEGAERVHGLTRDFLAKHRRFAEEADAILEFIGDAKLVMHNAPFDLGFLNAELERIGKAPIPPERTVDTLVIARRKFPGAPASLDALCKRFGIDRSQREKHGALLDAELADRRLSGTHRRPSAGARAAAGDDRSGAGHWHPARPAPARRALTRRLRKRPSRPRRFRRDPQEPDLERLSDTWASRARQCS